ncbi:hypothetical protein MW695_14665 [Alkalihalobacillus sp. APA_J-10(15)]|nr:hypothetical protein [Halalkalibacter sp. APA_J-10(15)]
MEDQQTFLKDAFQQLQEAIEAYERTNVERRDRHTLRRINIYLKEKDHLLEETEVNSVPMGHSVFTYYKRTPIHQFEHYTFTAQPFNQWTAKKVWRR